MLIISGMRFLVCVNRRKALDIGLFLLYLCNIEIN